MQQGIALLQVLLITAVLSLLGLFMTKTARQQIEIASSFDNRAQALVNNYDAEATVLFALLTESKSPTSPFSNDLPELTQVWNFYGEAFRYGDQATISLQDLRGLLNIRYPSEQRWLRILTQKGLSDYDARLLLSQIQDWQDVDKLSRYSLPESGYKNGVIQTWSELSHLNIPRVLSSYLEQNATIYKKSIFNPMTAPDSLLHSLYDAPVVEQLIKMRKDKTLTPALFTAYTGVSESQSITLFPSSNYKIKIETQLGGARVNRTLYYLLDPNKSKPVNLVASEG
ncbi:hypothetical protein EAG18_03930 [Pseudoalteromonas sp. J010]|uniref:general secretion pathway protein GspK n=1 Tax=Pseudoalteromonas sp. J010 TaxID=998465 RepID=UPI000F653782|nr:type II secretion system protein GspK [Pseudoalteromonas sp. J010]RRS10088.1 hypothetical protein EAG18_03930 [Pseudoalteromonas sp. J010]